MSVTKAELDFLNLYKAYQSSWIWTDQEVKEYLMSKQQPQFVIRRSQSLAEKYPISFTLDLPGRSYSYILEKDKVSDIIRSVEKHLSLPSTYFQELFEVLGEEPLVGKIKDNGGGHMLVSLFSDQKERKIWENRMKIVVDDYVRTNKLKYDYKAPRAWTLYNNVGPHITLTSDMKKYEGKSVRVFGKDLEHFTDEETGTRWIVLNVDVEFVDFKGQITCPYPCHISIGQCLSN